MNEVESGQGASAASPPRAGEMLRAARERQGMSLAEVGTRTRVPLRHLEAIEASDYQALPSTTYATGFAKAYARAVGADEVKVAAAVRAEVAKLGRRTPEYEPYQMADPARVPSRGIATVGVGVALALLILAGLWYGTDWFRGTGPSTATSEVAAVSPAVPAAAPSPATAPAPANGGQVTLTANDEVWVRVYDAADKTLFIGTMKPGDRFDVPADANDPKINVGRPDKLSVTLNGSVIPALGTGERPIKDVPVSATAIQARIAGQTGPQPTADAGDSAPAATPPASGGSRTVAAARPTSRPARPRPARHRRVLTETQRANLQSAAHPPAAAPFRP